jgi:regulator of protease activity HflC (stomatin/prohibitin superfamily)
LKEIGKKNAFSLLPVFLLCLWLGSCLHLIPTGHQGILKKLETVQNVLEPGLHVSLPYPFGHVEIIQTSKIHRLEIGGTGKQGEALLWNEGGHGDDTYLIFQDGYGQHDLPIEVYAVNALLTYRIKDVLNFRYQHKDPLQTMYSETKSLLVQGALNLSRSSLLEQERTQLNAQWKDKLQQKLNELKLGIELLHFGLPQIHPPSETNESFQELANARNQRESKILEAQGMALQKQALQDSATFKQVQNAYAQATKILTQTQGDYESLLLMQPVAEMNQEFFIKRRLLQKMIDLKNSMRKIALFTQTPIEVQSLNLEAELEPELLNLNLE